jgi:hypothetical protein
MMKGKTPAAAQAKLRPTMSMRWLLLAVGCTVLAGCPCTKHSQTLEPRSVASPHTSRSNDPQLKPQTSPVGTNLSGIADWTTEHPFVDVFKTSREWISTSAGKWSDDRPLDLDERGWVRSLRPGQYARTLALWDSVHYSAGRHVVLYDGEGEIKYDEGGASNRFIAEESRPGRHVVDIDPARGSQGLNLVITSTNPANPIRNIRVLMPGGVCANDYARACDKNDGCGDSVCEPYERNYDKVIFNPAFLERVRPFSAIRFMDWMATNSSQVASWSQRPRIDDARWSINGVPVEIMVKLANRLEVEPWFTMPHRADDNYVRRFAAAVREQLDSRLPAWVEFSNEVWNDIFQQKREVARCANGGGGHEASSICYAERAVQVFEIWREVFGEQRGRVRAVLASQAANPWVTEQILTHREAFKHANALAIAPYFGVTVSAENEKQLEHMSVEQLIALTRSKQLPETVQFIREQRKLAARFGLSLVSYEGGPSFDAQFGHENNDAVNQLFDAVNRDPRLGELYGELLKAWRKEGGELFVNYTSCSAYSKWGRFGLLEYVTQTRTMAPKYDSVLRFIEGNQRWW